MLENTITTPMQKEKCQKDIQVFMEDLMFKTADKAAKELEAFGNTLIGGPLVEAIEWEVDMEGSPVIVTLQVEWKDGDIQSWRTLPITSEAEDTK